MRYQRPVVLLVIAALLPLVVLAASLGYAWLRQQHARMQEEALARADRIAALLEQELGAQITHLNLVAASPLFDRPLDPPVFFATAQALLQELPLWHTIVLSDSDGNRLIDVPEPVGGAPGRVVDTQSHGEVVRSLKPVVGRVLKGPRNRPAFAIRVPVVRDGRLLYVLSAVISPAGIRQLLLAGGIPEGWRGAVVDASGSIAALTAPGADRIGEPASPSALAAIASGHKGLYEVQTLDGLPLVTAFHALSGSGWTVHVGIPREIYLNPLRRSAWLLTASAIASLGLVGAFLWLLWRELGVRRRTEAALEETRRLEALGRITGGVAHDFNNLLMIVLGSAEAILRRSGTDKKLAGFAEAIMSAASRGERLTRQLLAFAGRGAGEACSFRLQDRQGEIFTLIRQSVRGDIRLEVSIPADLWPIHADPHALELALINLAVNARDAMPSGGALSISAANCSLRPGADIDVGLRGEFVALTVTDTGHGIPKQHIGRIFEPFYTTKPTGTGLGLSQVYGFAKQAGGAVTASSTPAGATFILHLPRAAEAPAPQIERPAASALPHGTRGRALLVEDNPEVAKVVEAMLTATGFKVTAESNGRAALNRLQEGARFEVVLTDIVMEGMSGLELAREIRTRRPDLPVALMTGYSDALRRGSSDGLLVLSKPFRQEELDAVLAQLGLDTVRAPQGAQAPAGA